MTSSSAGSRPLVIDASYAVRAVLSSSSSQGCRRQLATWVAEDRALLSPPHWIAEAVSALRKFRSLGEMSPEETDRAVEDLFALEIESIPCDLALCRAALDWADRMTHSKAYDAFYLALAETREAELWTTDERLENRARQLGADWVHSAGA